MEYIPFKELKKAAEPLEDFLKQYGDYHSAIIITREKISVVSEVQGVPLEVED